MFAKGIFGINLLLKNDSILRIRNTTIKCKIIVHPTDEVTRSSKIIRR